MSQVTLSIPDDVLRALQGTPDDIAATIRFAAAELAGVPKPLLLPATENPAILHRAGEA